MQGQSSDHRSYATRAAQQRPAVLTGSESLLPSSAMAPCSSCACIAECGERVTALSLQAPGSRQVQCTSRRNLSLCIYMYDVCTHHVTARVHVADSVHAGGAGTSNLTRISHDLHVLGLCLPAISIQYSVICLRGNCVIRRTQKVIQGDDNGHVGRPC